MKFNAFIVLIFGVIVILGGLVGYLTAGSIPSLVAGSIFGAAIIGGAMGMLRESLIGYFLCTILAAILTVFFTHRYISSHQLVPAGVMAIMSVLILILLLTTKRSPHIK